MAGNSTRITFKAFLRRGYDGKKGKGGKNTKEKIHILYLLNFKEVMEGGKKDGDKNGHMLTEVASSWPQRE